MQRSDFKEWGKKLTEESFWQAVAAVGVSQGFYPGLLRRLLQDVESGRPLHWRLSPGDLYGLREVPARPQNWRSLIFGKERQDWPRLEIVPPSEEGDLSELLEGLARHAARSVYVALASSGPPPPGPHWRRPLRVGLWPAPSPELARELQGLSCAEAVSIAEADTRSFDLLVLPTSLAGAREALSSFPVAVRTTALLLSGGRAPGSALTLRQVEELRELTQARAVACAAVRAGEGMRWLEAVTKNLGEDLPLDLALQTPELLAEGEPAILFAEPGLVTGREGPVKGLVRSTGEEWLRESEPPEPPEEREEGFERKPEGAYSLPGDEPFPTRSPRPTRAPREGKEQEGRFLQARVLERGAQVRYLEPGRTYGVAVRIGAPESGALVAGRRFPDHELPDGENLLTVVFSEPNLLETPQVKTLLLPPSGPSTVCTFQLPVPRQAREVTARLTVLYENRVLQTALLRGEVGRRLSLTIERVVRAGMKNLSRQRPFEGAMILDATGDGTAAGTLGAGYDFVHFSIAGIEQAVEKIEARINGVSWDDADHASLDAPGSQKLLRFLARQGAALLRDLKGYVRPDHPLVYGDGPVQLVSAVRGARIPLEFLYRKTPPNDDAALCPRWRQALATGACSCPDDGSVFCPLGFWCFSRVLERHRFRIGHSGATNGLAYALADAPPGEREAALQPLSGAVLGASRRVAQGDRDKLIGALEQRLGGSVTPAQGWQDWVSRVQSGAPSLLVLLPHTAADEDDMPTLEIEGQPLASDRIGPRHVLGPAGLPKPIVLLLGCNTDNAGLPFESFVPAFADQQAAVVVTSLSKVLGRHAAPLAALFLDQLAAFPNDGSHRFGEVMREVRRRAALDGPPLALVLKAYGDADWRI